MAIREINFPSYNERDTIRAWLYTPIIEPKAVVQIVHGFGEHSRRYLHMILQMLDAGFVVCADDHVGHGKTAADGNTWGDYGYKGYATTTEDEFTLHNLVSKEYPNLPYIMFGHSWGSMIARDYASKHGDTLTGLVICGTVSAAKDNDELQEKLQALIDEGKGSEPIPEYVSERFKGYVVRFGPDASPNSWIAKDEGVVWDHGADPFNNLQNPVTIQSYHDFVSLWKDVCCPEWAKTLPKTLPIYLIAGDQDPVGNYGEGIYQVSNWLWETGNENAQTKIYPGYRHEIHNEPEIRDEVEQGVISFIQSVL